MRTIFWQAALTLLLFAKTFDNATAYSAVSTNAQSDLADTISQTSLILIMQPTNSLAYYERGLAFMKLDKLNQAILDFDDAIRLKPDDAKAYFERGAAKYRKGDFDKAISDYNEAIRLQSNSANAYFNRSLAWSKKGEWDKVISDDSAAIGINPKNAKYYNERGLALCKKEQWNSAIKDYTEAINLNPTNVIAYDDRAVAENHTGAWDKAIQDFTEAIRISPDSALTHNNLAWLLATCSNASFRNGKQAVEEATRACELSKWKNWYCVGTLAAAYAETGNFEPAVKYEKQAMAMETMAEKDRAEAQKQLELYEQSKPYHEPLKSP